MNDIEYVISDRDRVELPVRGGGSAVIPVSGTHVDLIPLIVLGLSRSLIDQSHEVDGRCCGTRRSKWSPCCSDKWGINRSKQAEARTHRPTNART
jgi:hypothetical protein